MQRRKKNLRLDFLRQKDQIMTIKIRVKGAVQGVGFRPFIAETATKYGIKGNVKNIGAAVDILAIGNRDELDLFIESIKSEYPAGALILDLSAEEIVNYDETSLSEFMIVPSDEIDLSSELPVFLPDIGICDDCMNEMLDEKDRRYHYPLISCAVCGPRVSILNKLPYDRNTTTMIDFEMCGDCDSEYRRGRRRHAQTISCHSCGPQMIFRYSESELNKEEAVEKAIEILSNGGIIGLKGISGYQLVCLPTTEAATRLRELKGRERKPFAVMFSVLEEISEYCYVNDREKDLLLSSARPIVLLQKKKDFPEQVCRDSRYIGAFLPSSGIHRLLCDELGPLIVTSANKSDQPMIYSDEKFFDIFLDEKNELHADGVLYHKRKINIAQDDSVLFVIRSSKGFSTQFIRRSRGYFPLPVLLKNNSPESCSGASCNKAVLALGADLKNTFAFAKKDKIIPSQHLGDLADVDVFEEYKKLIPYCRGLFHFSFDRMICDKHPGYFSSGYAAKLLQANNLDDSSIIKVQHHHAHIFSVMAESGIDSCIGISFDGTGYGDDGKVWGGEYFYCNETSVKRFGHMSYIKLCGGDMAPKKADLVRDCYRFACDNDGESDIIPDIIRSALNNNINTYETSSVGRLFDAVSSLLGICGYNSYEGECATALEKEAWKYTGIDRPEFELKVYRDDNGNIITDQADFFRQIVECQREGKYNTVLCAYAFHVAITTAIKSVCDIIREETGEKKVCLSGGVFMNRLLLTKTINLLSISGYEVYWNQQVPASDAGISLGQAYYGLMLSE
ncbi:carbamoyltransferase HypF [Butyrivibrio sp. DSM 10294]|uniref:carbamoyltransferase HypF n=1 Tax=Butyrivibrio sp. DSM 10294 TaxID=2972457 RepID=UPI00234F144D|nr:carbamoyltransferase HypF [Butyrivibrio sp. DSM 10294]MDC7295279.1 carbamoyltransferase HypF [Butyrivibrio sp. DSM 10294]